MEKTTWDFGSVTAGVNGAEIIYAQNVDVSWATQAQLLLRVHAGGVAPASTTLSLFAFQSAPTSEDPATIFRQSGTGLITATVTQSQQQAAQLLPFALTTPFGAWVDFSMRPTYVIGGGVWRVTLSVDLVLKS